MSNIKLILVDLDETLLTTQKTISILNREAIIKCNNKGVYISLATGRSGFAIDRFINELELQNNIHICQNGLVLYNQAQNKRKIIANMGYEKFIALRNILKDLGLCYFTFDVDCALFETEYDIQRVIDDDPRRFFDKKVVDFTTIKDPLKISCLFKGEEEYKRLCAIAEKLDLGINKVAKTNANFIPKGVDKYTTALKLAESLNISTDEMASIGDTTCDIKMLSELKHGYAVKNADEQVLKCASNVLPYDNNEDSFYHLINEYLFI